MDTEVSQIIQTYKRLACNPSPGYSRLQISPENGLINIFSSWTIPDLIREESTRFVREFLLQYQNNKYSVLSHGLPCDISSVSHLAFTKSDTRHAVLRKTKKTEESIFLEVWNGSQKECTFDMNDRKEHGKICDSGDLQTFEWSANEKYLLYFAEMKRKKSESYFKDLFCQKKDQKGAEEVTKGEENLYQESWGECNASVFHPVLCIFEVETGNIEVVNLDDKYPNITAGQGTWGPNDEHIVFVGYKEDPYRLGLTYCSNRSSSIFSYNVKTKTIERLTSDENICVEYPVFSPNFETFVFVQNKSGGPHKSCKKLMKCDWKTKNISTVIDIVDEPYGEDFAGIYITKLSSRWWSKDSQYFFFHTFRRSFLELFCVEVASMKIQKINIDKMVLGSCTLLDVKDPYILISVAAPNRLPNLMIGHFSILENGIQVSWSPVNEIVHLQDISWDVRTISPSLPDKTYPNLDYDVIVVSPNENRNGTLVIFPHGGPHSVFPVDFSVNIASLVRLGYIVCLVNYRGSIGFGENSIKSLLGNIGLQDVADVVNAVERLKEDKKLEIRQVVGFGGSHGGYLVGHLLGQYPDLLKAAVIRNPVIDLSTMASTSDIPDWVWIETGCSQTFSPTDTVDPSILQRMWEKSPIKYVKKVKSPTLLCLGKNDLRVPASQGLLFYKYLKAQNVPTKVFYFDDNHALSKVGVSSDSFVNIALWFRTHLL